jgi:hypothetical protein
MVTRVNWPRCSHRPPGSERTKHLKSGIAYIPDSRDVAERERADAVTTDELQLR